MKIRFGFVSNSSSSSFIVAVKGKLTENVLMEAFKVEKSSIFYKVSKDICKYIIENSTKITNKSISEESYNDTIEEYWNEHEDLKELKDEGYTIYEGSVSDEGGDYLESFLCGLEINYKTDKLVIQKDSDY